MLLEKYWLPLRAPEGVEGAVDTPVDGGAPPPEAPAPMNERPVDGPGSGRSELRKQLESSAEKARKAPPKDDKGKYQSRARTEMETPEPAPEEGAAEEAAPAEGAAPEPATPAPEAWTKEAKAEWAKLPPAVQAAAVKREADMAAGVEALKKNYKEIDTALAPRMEAIRNFGTSPGAAVDRLFQWMEGLTMEAKGLKEGRGPNGTFAALARSYGIDPVGSPACYDGRAAGAACSTARAARSARTTTPAGSATGS